MRKTFALVLAGIPLAATAESYGTGDIQILDPVAHETPASAMAGAGYFQIVNSGETPDRLIAVRADFPRVMMHDTVVEDGIASMRHLEAVGLDPGEEVIFEPGGKHIMFMGLAGNPFVAGGEIPATLIFENSGEIDIVFTVIPADHQHGH